MSSELFPHFSIYHLFVGLIKFVIKKVIKYLIVSPPPRKLWSAGIVENESVFIFTVLWLLVKHKVTCALLLPFWASFSKPLVILEDFTLVWESVMCSVQYCLFLFIFSITNPISDQWNLSHGKSLQITQGSGQMLGSVQLNTMNIFKIWCNFFYSFQALTHKLRLVLV